MAIDYEKMEFIDRYKFNRIFALLKLTCDQVATKPSKECCKELSNILNSLHPDLVHFFKDYIVCPLFLQLSHKNVHKSEMLCCLLECLHLTIEKIRIVDAEEFTKTLHFIVIQIDVKDYSLLSEELKLLAVKCIRGLFQSSLKTTLEQVYSREFYSKISVVMFACTKMARNETFLALKLEALRCILTFVQAHSRFENPDFKDKVADIVMLMLPGIMSLCIDVTTGSDIQNHKIILSGIQLWGRTIGLVMEDSTFKTETPTVFKINDTFETIEKKEHDIKVVVQKQKRDQNWLKLTGKRLTEVMPIMVELVQHDNYKVRKQLAIEINYMLSEASRTMVPCLSYLIDPIIILSQDKHPEVAIISKEAIENFSEKSDLNNERKLVEVIEECLYSLLTKLPRILRGVDISLKENHLQLLGGYIDLLGKEHFQKMMNSSQHLSRLVRNLQIAATLECNMVSLLEEMSIREIDVESTMNDSVWKQFKYSSTLDCQLCLESLCKKLIKNMDISVIIHNLIDDFNTNIQNRKEITVILNYMLHTDTPGEHSDKEEFLRTVLLTIMEPLLSWKLPVNVGEDGSETRSEAQSNVILTCLLTECVSTIAVSLGQDAFSSLIFHCLYPVLENAGSPLFAVSVAGLKSMSRIAKLYGGGVGELVAQNVDYLSHHVTVNLKHVEKNPKVLSVLSVIMKHSTMDVLPSLYDIVNDVLVQSCDEFQEVNRLAFLHVFHTFVSCLLQWINDNNPQEKPIEIKKPKTSYEELLDYHKTNLESDAWKKPDNHQEEKIQEVKTEDKNSPDYVKFTIEILKRSLHFLPSKDVSLQIIVLQILEKGVLILHPFNDDLLPVVYKIWSPLVSRFDYRNNPLIIHRAFSLLTTLAYTSKDFVRLQTLKEVMPSLCKVLKNNAEKSKKELSTGSYVLSQIYKLQLTLLTNIGDLCVDMELEGKEIENILESLDPYLSKLQPKMLQEACLSSYLKISTMDSDTVWVHLMSLSPENVEIISPHPELNSFKIRSGGDELMEYKFNIDFILEKINDYV